MPRTGPQPTAPLDGVLVADFSRVLAGPLATMHLADLGATVVKVERPGAGDETRAWGPPWSGQSGESGDSGDTSSYFAGINRSKWGLTLDLADPDDLDRARELARRADVMIQNFRPGGLTRHGLDHESVAAANPRVVYCSISGFGPGAGADRPGYDFLVQAVGGLMSVTGEPDREPMKVGVALVDVLTGKDAVIGILAALARRERTGRGDHVEVNLLSSLLGGLVNQASGYLATGTPPGRMGNAHPSVAPYETLACADGRVAVACGNDGQFRRLAGALGRPELADDARFATNPARVINRATLVPLLEEAMSSAGADEWERRLAAAGVPAGQVEDIGAAVERARGYGLDPLLDVGAGHAPQVRHPIRYADARTAAPSPPPVPDEHGDAIRAWLAGGAPPWGS